ncbi:transcription-repair coupling factor, partial [Rickettsiella grylli]|uniref:transcription-repair coupling factor n=1 Tax=Rickettsiella grylli TaxID=59196 RepID=UPI0008FCF570
MSISQFLKLSVPTEPGQQLCLSGLQDDSLAFAVHQFAERYDGVILVLTPDNPMTNRLAAALKFFSPDETILHFPDWETLPYDHFSPHEDIISQRLLTLAKLQDVARAILLVPVTTLMQRIAPLNYIQATTLSLACGEKKSIEIIRKNLQLGGYHSVSQVGARGEFASRGSILDIFPMGSELPYRIDFVDDEIDSLRYFDPDTQRSIKKIEKIQLLPAREFPLSASAIHFFRQQWRENFVGNPLNCPLYEAVSEGRVLAGIEYYLPLFFQKTALLLDYLPNKAFILSVNEVHDAAENFWKEINERYEQLRYDRERPLLPPHDIYVDVHALFARLKEFPKVSLDQKPKERADPYHAAVKKFPNLMIDHRREEPLERLNTFLNEFLKNPEARVLFCAESAGRREVLFDLLNQLPIQVHRCGTWKEFIHSSSRVNIIVAPLEEGFYLDTPPWVLMTEGLLLGNHVIQKRRTQSKALDSRTIIRNLAELTEGSPVVHIDHGVGRYRGLQHLKIDDKENEFLIVEYAAKAKLYVPVSSLHLISRYSGNDSEQAPLHQLGSEQWEKAKRKAAEALRDVACELLDSYARRAASKGYAFHMPEEDYQAFAAQFPFTETQDQAQAIQQVIQDMTSERAMDRLVCGDVGFGKTEVAMRAAFLAVHSNKQVALLVPTTLLAQQHYQNFCDRFAEWPVHVEMISRFRSIASQKKILERLQQGKIDILVGTHKLLSKELKFPRLGLLIIDEEHRFGVQQKERLKALRAQVDILSLTATPIPRTLNMALSGLRELSIIATPPARRLSIKTFVQQRNTRLIREAILRELFRGGQVYFLHNQVDSIEKVARELEALVPEARIQVAHGQLRESQLERVMADFYHQRFNVLLCTTIIESGIDVPSANTIIIDRADKFGLAQLHQLRGRVGRSHHQAYAYLMTPPPEMITADAMKRLEAFISLEDLGAGFSLAMHDLEIRGAGEVLGEQQSGNMQSIGFSLYMELLEQTVDALKSGKEPSLKSLNQTLEMDLQVAALIPENYLPDVHMRLVLYKRIAHAKTEQELEHLQVEMIDRFGLLPETLKNLFRLSELKLQAQKIVIKKIIAGPKGGRIEFNEKPHLNPAVVIQLIQENPARYQLEGATRLRFSVDQP